MTKVWLLLLIKKALCCKIYHKSAHFPYETLTHMTDLMTYPHTTSHISHNHKCFQAFSLHGSIHRKAFRHGAHGDPRLRRQEIATTLGLPQSTTKRWLQMLRSDGDMVSRNIGRPRGAEAGLCVMSFLHVRLASLGMSCVPLVCRSMAAVRSAFVPQRSSTLGFLSSHVAQSLVIANVCRRLASSAAAAVSRNASRCSTGQRSGKHTGPSLTCFFLVVHK